MKLSDSASSRKLPVSASGPVVCPFPPAIKRVGLCLPAGPADQALLQAGCRQLEFWGIAPVFASVRAPVADAAHRYLSGSDCQRAAELLELLQDPGVDVVLAVRGGFGCARLLDILTPRQLANARKTVVGYSDITVLHALSFSAGLSVNLSGPMLAVEFARLQSPSATALHGWDALAFSFRSLREAWVPGNAVSLPASSSLTVIKEGAARGRVFPATLSVLVSLLGTSYFPDLTGAILVLEDVNEPCYRIDRFLTQLRQSRILQGLAGMLWGSFEGVDDRSWLAQLVREFSAYVPGPVASDLPYGHIAPSITVPVGRIGRFRTCRNHVQELSW